MELLFLILGIIIGVLLTCIIAKLTSGRGRFKLNPLEDEPSYFTVQVGLIPTPGLVKKKYIILTRE